MIVYVGEYYCYCVVRYPGLGVRIIPQKCPLMVANLEELLPKNSCLIWKHWNELSIQLLMLSMHTFCAGLAITLCICVLASVSCQLTLTFAL